LTHLQEQLDALMSIVNRNDARLDAFVEAFYRHVHEVDPTGENAVKANVERLEAVRHDG